ncbi:MAG: TetR/AcrR family transcriptional regulator C-terminal domain-containing protein [Clostridia bacterium]|nr:TetR/AcrR family transcriptional regulator C-terminal domain-containing protein [Clostridia bacterium]
MVQNSETKIDRRVLYTKMFLKESLLELMKEKPIDKITPTELCRHAGINRNTFYKHYYTTRDLLQEIEEEFSAQLVESIGEILQQDNIQHLLQEICSIVLEKKEFCKVLFSANGDAAFMQDVIMLGKGLILENWERMGVQLSDEKMEIVFSFIINGSVAIMRSWAATDMQIPPAEIADLINRLTMHGISGVCD